MNTLHIIAGNDDQLVIDNLVSSIKSQLKDGLQVVMCKPGSVAEVFCMENDIMSFAVGGSFLSLLNDSGMLKRIAKNYNIDNVRIYDKKGNRIAKFARFSGKRK